MTKPSKEQKQAARKALQAIAKTNRIRPIVEGYQIKVLKEMQVFDADDDTILIVNPKYAWTMSDENFKIYVSKCNEEAKKVGLYVDEERCSLLIAETEEREAKRELAKAFEDIFIAQGGTSIDKLIYHIDLYNSFVDLQLNYMSQFV